MNRKEIEMFVTDDVVIIEVMGAKPWSPTVATLFSELEREGISIDLLCFAPSGHHPTHLIFSVCNRDFAKVLKTTAHIKKSAALGIIVQGGYSKITLCVKNASQKPGIISGCFSALNHLEAETALVSASGTGVSLLVPTESLDKMLMHLETLPVFCTYEV